MKAAIELIREADRGKLLNDLQQGVDDIVSAIEENRGAGTGEITLKIKIKSKSEGAYTITHDLGIKVPKPARSDMLMFMGDDGELQRADPRQPTLPSVVSSDELNRRRARDND
jgi:hypothetical protein